MGGRRPPSPPALCEKTAVAIEQPTSGPITRSQTIKTFPTGTIIRKAFNKKYFEGEVTGYDPKSKFYMIKYLDGDAEEMTFDATNNQLKAFFNGTEFVNTDFSSVNTSQWATFELHGFQRGPDGPGADIDYVYNFYPNKILTQIEVNDLQGKTQDNISTIFNYYN